MTTTAVSQLLIAIFGMLFLLSRAQDQPRMEQWPLGTVRYHKRTLDYDDYIDSVQEQISAQNIRSPVGMTRFGKRVSEPMRFQRNVGIMLSARSVFALLYLLLIAVAVISAAPNRILMRFGKRTSDPLHFRPMVPADYYPVELLGSSRAVDGDM